MANKPPKQKNEPIIPLLVNQITEESHKGEKSSELGARVWKVRDWMLRKKFLTLVAFAEKKLSSDFQMVILLALESDFIVAGSKNFVDPVVVARVLKVELKIIEEFLAHLKEFVGFEPEK